MSNTMLVHSNYLETVSVQWKFHTAFQSVFHMHFVDAAIDMWFMDGNLFANGTGFCFIKERIKNPCITTSLSSAKNVGI